MNDDNEQIFQYYPGTLPIIVSIPHAGTYVPPSILERFAKTTHPLPDTDWHVPRLYDFVRQLGVHLLVATHSRYVIDLNRASTGESLYPGKFTTGLCPTTLFDGTPVYQSGTELNEQEIQERIQHYWFPYHQKLQSILDELKDHPKIILFDAHSIRSHVHTLFEGELPDLNLGTADGVTINPELAQQLVACCAASPYSSVYNGRFKGGYITRHYGLPEKGINTIQLELAQQHYMDEAYPYTYQEEKATQLQSTLRDLFSIICKWV